MEVKRFFSIIVMTALFAVATTDGFSQVQGKWRGGLDFGYGFIPKTNSNSWGLPVDINLGYNLNKNMNIGFKFGYSYMNYRESKEEWYDEQYWYNSLWYNCHNFNITGTYTYFFGKRTNLVIPFIGGGLGLYVLNARANGGDRVYIEEYFGNGYSVDGFESYASFSYNWRNNCKFGGFFTAGLEIGKFRLTAKYELLPASKFTLYTNDYFNKPLSINKTFRNSYLTFTAGFYLGGGNPRKERKREYEKAAEREKAMKRKKEAELELAAELEKTEKERIANQFSAFAEDYIHPRIKAWQQKGEFERTTDWELRVNDKNREEKRAELRKEAEQVFIAEKSKKMPVGYITLGTYDADKEVFLIRNTVHGDWFESVSLAEAPSFKENWNNLEKIPQFTIRNDKIAFAGYKFSPPEVAGANNKIVEQKENQKNPTVSETTEIVQSEVTKNEVVEQKEKQHIVETKQSEKIEQKQKEIIQEQGKTEQEISRTNTNTKNANTTNKIFRFGIRAGMNFTNMFGYDGLSKMLFGVQSGIVTDFSLPKNFSIQPALLYAQQGYRMTGRYMGQKSTLRITLHYIQIPINVQYKLKVANKASLLFQTGPYFGICFLGTGSSDGITLPIRMGNSERDELKRFDFGLGLGVGAQFYGLQVGIGYNFGLYNLRHQYYSEKLRNHGLAITVTYLFGK